MPNWLRWLLVLPVALAGYLGIQILVGIGSENLPLSDSLQDSASQLINSFLGPWAFVYPSSKLVPEHHQAQTAKFMMVLFILTTIAIGYFIFISGDKTHSASWLVTTSVIGFVSAFLAYRQVCRGG